MSAETQCCGLQETGKGQLQLGSLKRRVLPQTGTPRDSCGGGELASSGQTQDSASSPGGV